MCLVKLLLLNVSFIRFIRSEFGGCEKETKGE